MNLNIGSWKEFEIGKIFRIEPTKGIITEDLVEGKDIPYIAAKHDLNGLSMMCKSESFDSWISKGNCIVFVQIGAGAAGYVNYIESDFIGMQGKTCCGYIDGIMNPEIGMFLETILCQERNKYSFGRSRTGERLKKTIIKLPVDNSGNPNRKFMEDYIKSLKYKPITTKNKSGRNKLNIHERKEFRVGDVLECSTTKLSIKDNLDIGETPLISRTAMNNGCDGYFDIEQSKITKKGCITIGAEGIYAFYQPEDFGTGNKVYTLKNNKLNKYSALFICTILNKEDYKYSYGRARILSKIVDEIIKLPVDKNGNPDREFMENYIKNLPYGDRI